MTAGGLIEDDGTDPARLLGAYILPGRVGDPRAGIGQARAGEQLGLGSIWVSERWDTKEIGSICGALTQATTTTRIVAGTTHFVTRHPLVLAGLGSTLQALSGGRFVMGVARSSGTWLTGYGLPMATNAALADYAGILRRLWNGESFSYDGPAGTFPNLRLVDGADGGGPPLVLATVGPRGLEVAGAHFDGVLLHPFLTLAGVEKSLAIVRAAAERAGRDPAAIRSYATVLVAPDLAPAEQAAVVGGRAVTYLQRPQTAALLSAANGWDPRHFHALQNHPMFAGSDSADQGFRREQLVEVSALIPADILASVALVGTAADCAARLPDYLDAGADEILLHGSTPDQCGPLVTAFRTVGRHRVPGGSGPRPDDIDGSSDAHH